MKVLIMSDEQIPFEDRRAIIAVHKYIRDFQPDVIIHNGDLLDFPDLTTKFQRHAALRGTTLADITIAKSLLQEELKLAPKARIIILEGNHEDRLRILVEENADGLEPFLADELSLARMLSLPRVEFIGGYKNGNAYWEHGGLVVTHGSDITGAGAGQKMLNREGSVVYGHTHRSATFSRTNRVGTHKAWSFGCLCNISGPKVPPRSGNDTFVDWQNGIGIVYFGRTGYSVYPIDIIEGRFISPEGKEYSG